MKNVVDRYTKTMLTLLVVGIWAVFLHSLLIPTPSQAAPGHKCEIYCQEDSYDHKFAGLYPDYVTSGKGIQFCVSSDNIGKALQHASANGWHIVSVFQNDSGYVIVVER